MCADCNVTWKMTILSLLVADTSVWMICLRRLLDCGFLCKGLGIGLFARSRVLRLGATLCSANREQQGLTLNADMGATGIKPVVVVCLLGQLRLKASCISTVAGCLLETTVRKTEAQGTDTRKPLIIQLADNNVSVTLTEIFVAPVVHWTR